MFCSSFFLVLRVLSDWIVLIRARRRLVEWFFQTRRRFKFVTQYNENIFFLKEAYLYHADDAFAWNWRCVNEFLTVISFVCDWWQNKKAINDFVEIQIHENWFCRRNVNNRLRVRWLMIYKIDKRFCVVCSLFIRRLLVVVSRSLSV